VAENRTVRNKAQRWVFAALTGISVEFPFPIRGIDSDNGCRTRSEDVARGSGVSKRAPDER
jgi:hypothetical protein